MRPEVVLVPVEVARDLAGADPTGGVVDRMVVAEALAALPAAYREVIVLADLLDFPADGPAAGHRVRAAKSRLHRARRALAALLGQPELRRSA
jgi:DNA-directed RNA polymerase specialized sigma24 family protein